MKISELIERSIGRAPLDGELFQETWPVTDGDGVDDFDYGSVFLYRAEGAFREDSGNFGEICSYYVTAVDSWEGAPWA